MLIKSDSGKHHQHIAGFISAEGEIISGEDIQEVTHSEPGLYKIGFKDPFKKGQKPAVVATLFNSDKDLSTHAVITYDVAEGYVYILTGNVGCQDQPAKPEPADSAFSFIAFGESDDPTS
jgi:hypothetical protein